MAYSELIKDFRRIRPYLRSFYVEGFRHRGDFGQKSARSYDNERRRLESWLGDYVFARQDNEGRRVFLSVDSRAMPSNPLYQPFKAKSFTTWDITLHFHVLDILVDRSVISQTLRTPSRMPSRRARLEVRPVLHRRARRESASGGSRVASSYSRNAPLGSDDSLSITQIMDELADRLYEFDSNELPDESTVRKKLNEYVDLGLLRRERRGRETVYALAQSHVDIDSWDVALAFLSEIAPLGVIGSFIQDRLPQVFNKFRFKHHYILNALDSEVLCALLHAIGERRLATIKVRGQRMNVLPLRVYVGTQTGRQHVIAWSPANDLVSFWRLDLISRVRVGKVLECPQNLDRRLENYCSRAWGVAGNDHRRLQHVEMTLYVGTDEQHVAQRLEREKRCGTVEQLDATHWRFVADVHDALEMLPWLRTFTGRVTDLQCSNDLVTKRFWNDFETLCDMYGNEG